VTCVPSPCAPSWSNRCLIPATLVAGVDIARRFAVRRDLPASRRIAGAPSTHGALRCLVRPCWPATAWPSPTACAEPAARQRASGGRLPQADSTDMLARTWRTGPVLGPTSTNRGRCPWRFQKRGGTCTSPAATPAAPCQAVLVAALRARWPTRRGSPRVPSAVLFFLHYLTPPRENYWTTATSAVVRRRRAYRPLVGAANGARPAARPAAGRGLADLRAYSASFQYLRDLRDSAALSRRMCGTPSPTRSPSPSSTAMVLVLAPPACPGGVVLPARHGLFSRIPSLLCSPSAVSSWQPRLSLPLTSVRLGAHLPSLSLFPTCLCSRVPQLRPVRHSQSVV